MANNIRTGCLNLQSPAVHLSTLFECCLPAVGLIFCLEGQAREGMKMAKCTAIASNGRMSLVIRKNDEGYEEFVKVLEAIAKDRIFSWYGDVEDENGKEQNGLVITSNERASNG